MKIYIYSGPVNSGKTTKLMQWSISQKNIDGIFQPVVDGKRYIYQIGSRTLKLLESNGNQVIDECVTIGKYKFLKSTFDWCKKVLLDCSKKELDWLIIDEVGPLELDRKGLEPAITQIFNNRDNIKAKILCVVREDIMEKFTKYYKLESDIEIFKLLK